MKKNQLLPMILNATFLILSGCYRKLSSDELWEKANEEYSKSKYQEAASLLEKIDRDYPFGETYLDSLILLVKTYDKRKKEVPLFKNRLNLKICKMCDEIILRDKLKGFANGILTMQIRSQYELCVLDLRFSDKMLHDTAKLIEQYFEYIAELYKKKVPEKKKIGWISELILHLIKLPKLENGPDNLELEAMNDIYNKCQDYIKEKRRLMVSYTLRNSGTANALQENENLSKTYENRDPALIQMKIKLYLQMQTENLNTVPNSQLEGFKVVDDVISMISDMEKLAGNKALLRLALDDLNKFINKFSIKTSAEQSKKINRIKNSL